MSVDFKTFGCKVNTYDTSLLEKNFQAANLNLAAMPQVHVLNTCAVTGEATKEAIREVRRLKRKDPKCLVVVTGCAAQVDTEKFALLHEADLVVANSHKSEIPNLLTQYLQGQLTERVFKSNIFKKEDFEPGGGTESSHTRTFLKIQDGCNSFCTFCVIPFARGKSRSLSIEALRQRVTELHGQGFQEVVLTGVHIGDYEFGLENLIEDILENTNIQRLRLTSLEPIELNDRLLDLYTHDKMCKHFHMSMQSASTPILHRMKRKYGSAEVVDSLNRINKKIPNAFVGMDVIVGFPGEGESEFLDTYKNFADTPWTRIHVFPYSERPGTYATKLDGKLDRSVILRQADRLRELSSLRYDQEAVKQIGQTKQVLILNKRSADGNVRGLSRDFWNIEIEGSGFTPGAEILAAVTAYDQTEASRMDGLLKATSVL